MRRLLVLMAVALAACSAGQGVPGRTLRVMMADDWAEADVVLDVVREFESAHRGVRVDLMGRPFNQIPEEVAAAAGSGQVVDVVHHHAFAVGAIGLAEPLDELWQDGTFEATAYFPGAVEDVMWGETAYGVPLDVNAMLLIHDPDVSPPRTFAEVRAVAEAEAAQGRRGLTLAANSWEAYGWIRANGGEIVEVAADGTPRFTLDAPRVVEALDFLGSLIADGLAHGPMTRGVSSDAFELFGVAETPLLFSGTWSVAALEEAFPQRRYAIATMPAGQPADRGAGADSDPAATAMGGSSLMVGRGSAQTDLAVAFIQALTADDVALRLALEEGRFPPRPDLYDRLGDAPGTTVLAEQLATATPMRAIAFPAVDTAFAIALDEILTGRASAGQALARAQAVVDRETGSS